ncbi:MAG: hypothetical protein IJ306_08875 [Oscillospiraceae bacterium]|nr:hypothetical protein [Oscillospiraceae bacterium]
MINGTKGTGIINAMTKGTSVSFGTPYVGLFKTMPGAGGTGGVELDYAEYSRVAINVEGIEGKVIMAAAASAVITDDDGYSKTQSSAQNQEIIYFPENESGPATTAVGVGIFESKTGGTPYLWKDFGKDEEGNAKTVDVPINSAPMFRIGKFKVKTK